MASCAHREFEVGAMRQELAAVLSSVQLLREANPGRKIAEIQGKLATVPLTLPGTLRRGGGPLWGVPRAAHRCPLGGLPMS